MPSIEDDVERRLAEASPNVRQDGDDDGPPRLLPASHPPPSLGGRLLLTQSPAEGLNEPLLSPDRRDEATPSQRRPVWTTTTTHWSTNVRRIGNFLPRLFEMNACSYILVGLLVITNAANVWSFVDRLWDTAVDRSPSSSKPFDIRSCAAELPQVSVDTFDANAHSVHAKALRWFTDGAGAPFVSDSPSCGWNSDFGQMYALVVIRESLRFRHESWNPPGIVRPADVCSRWSRIECDANGRVKSLRLNDASLRGTFPLEMTGLPYLEELKLVSNVGLGGTIPAEIDRLTKLRSLQIQNTTVGGTVPKELGKLTQLQILEMQNTVLSGQVPDSLCRLKERNQLSTLTIISSETFVCDCCTSLG